MIISIHLICYWCCYIILIPNVARSPWAANLIGYLNIENWNLCSMVSADLNIRSTSSIGEEFLFWGISIYQRKKYSLESMIIFKELYFEDHNQVPSKCVLSDWYLLLLVQGFATWNVGLLVKGYSTRNSC